MGTFSWASSAGPLAGYAAGYRRELERRGFSPRTVRGQLQVMGQLNRWLLASGVPLESAEARAGEFFAARQAAGQRRVPAIQTLAPLFAYLRGQQVLPPEAPAPAAAVEELLASYRCSLVRERGVAPLTALRYERMARRFLLGRMSRSGTRTGAEDLSGAEVVAYLVECCARRAGTSSGRPCVRSPGAARRCCLPPLPGGGRCLRRPDRADRPGRCHR